MEEKDTSLIDKAWDYYDKEDYEQARIFFEQALAAGDMNAACGLGNLYYCGYGVDQDYKGAVKYYEIGAKKSDVDCIANLGRCYARKQPNLVIQHPCLTQHSTTSEDSG